MTGPDIRTPIRVHVVDNEQIVCDYFVECLGAQPGIVVTGTSLNAAEVVATLSSAPADVVLMDIQMPIVDGIGATSAILERYRNTKVLLITHIDSAEDRQRARVAGALGILPKSTTPSEIAAVIRVAHRGHRVVTDIEDTIDEHSRARRLKERERDILALVGDGDTNTVIAGTLHTSVATVKAAIADMLELYQVRTRGQLAQRAMLMGLDAATVRKNHAKPAGGSSRS